MRLRSVSISRYKNLRDFSLDFAGDEFIDIFVGKNGSGKSNFLEALIEIFDHIYSLKPGAAGPGFDYSISWEIDGKVTRLDWNEELRKVRSITIDGKRYKSLQRAPLPANIIVYYSGQNDTVSALIGRYRDSYRRKVRNANVADLPRFIGIGPDYKAMLLALMLMMPKATRARQFLCAKLGIEGAGSKAVLTLRRPGKGVVKQTYRFDPFDSEELYWGVKGVARGFLDKLMTCITGGFSPGGLYDRDTDTYRLEIDVERFRETFVNTPQDEIFCQFNALSTLEMIRDISIPVQLGAQVEVTSRAFSDGQFQSIYLFAISELFKNRECITLLDEPDAFLHPEWQYDFLSQVLQISDQAARTNHILMSSHSASTISAKVQTRLRVFEVNGQAVIAAQKEKSEIIGSLSAGLISFSEQEAKLNIHHVLRNTTGPIVFTEGISDEIILETAWSKLHGNRARPFEIQGTFGCVFLGNLMRGDPLFHDHPGRLFFGVFDFDDAYNHWNFAGADFVQQDVARGLARKKRDQPGYFVLLPVPAGLTVRRQAVNPDTGQHFGAASVLPIELLFHDAPGLARWYCDDASRPGNFRRFQGSKTDFAKNVVPTLAAEHFACFRPLFEFIEAEIVARQAVAAQ